MKKILSTVLLFSFVFLNFCNFAYGDEYTSNPDMETVNVNENIKESEKGEIVENVFNNKIENLSTTYKKLNKKEYKRPTVYKLYNPYEVTFKNTGNMPIIMTTQTEVDFITENNSIIKSDSRRDIYLNTRKKDRGRHYAFQIPGIIIGTCISVGTFLLGTPIGYGVYKAMQHPTVKAARTNVNISQDLYSAHGLPLRFEPDVEYAVYFYPPKDKDKKNPTALKAIRIKNVSLDNELKDIEIPLINMEVSDVNGNVEPEDFKSQADIQEEDSKNNTMEENDVEKDI